MEGTRAPSQNFSPVIGDYFSSYGGVGSLVYSWLALKLLSCMFKSETEALEGFTAAAVAPESSSSLPCGHFLFVKFLSLSVIKASLKLAQTCSLIVPSKLVGVKRPVCRLRLGLRSTTSPLGVASHQMFRLKTTAASRRAWKLLTSMYEGDAKPFN